MPFGRKGKFWLAATSFASLAALAGAWLHGVGVLSFGYNLQPLSEEAYRTLARSPGWAPLTLDRDGAVLRGLVRRPSSGNTKWVMFLNGNEGHPLETGQRVLEALRGSNDWGCVVWAYRGYDGSGGSPSPKLLEDDALREYEKLLSDESLEGRRVHLVAFSLGTGIATSVAARASDPPVTLSLLAPYTKIDMLPGSRFVRHRYTTLDFLDGIRSHVLIVHGERDTVLPIEQGRTVRSRLGSRGTFLAEPDSGHLDLQDSAAAHAAVRAFIERN